MLGRSLERIMSSRGDSAESTLRRLRNRLGDVDVNIVQVFCDNMNGSNTAQSRSVMPSSVRENG